MLTDCIFFIISRGQHRQMLSRSRGKSETIFSSWPGIVRSVMLKQKFGRYSPRFLKPACSLSSTFLLSESFCILSVRSAVKSVHRQLESEIPL